MTDCIRKGNFKREIHICFKLGCNSKFYPGKSLTCNICNWKKCENNHCRCNLNKETSLVLEKFYSLLCEQNNYSKETIYALSQMDIRRTFCNSQVIDNAIFFLKHYIKDKK